MTQSVTLEKYSGGSSIIIEKHETLFKNWMQGLIHPSRVWIETWSNGPYGNPWNQSEPELLSPKEAKEIVKRFENKPYPEEILGMWKVDKMRIELVLS